VADRRADAAPPEPRLEFEVVQNAHAPGRGFGRYLYPGGPANAVFT
jgi:hypothetical protein